MNRKQRRAAKARGGNTGFTPVTYVSRARSGFVDLMCSGCKEAIRTQEDRGQSDDALKQADGGDEAFQTHHKDRSYACYRKMGAALFGRHRGSGRMPVLAATTTRIAANGPAAALLRGHLGPKYPTVRCRTARTSRARLGSRTESVQTSSRRITATAS